MKRNIPVAVAITICLGFTIVARAEVVQIDVKETFNADVIVNRQEGKQDPKQDMVDLSNFAYITRFAAQALQLDAEGLPDDGRFAATERHPEVQLAYRNTDDGNNARRSDEKGDSFTFKVPEKKFEQLSIFVMGGNGQPDITVTMTYADGTTDERKLQVPDWFDDVQENDPERFALIDNLDRYNLADNTLEDVNAPAIFGLNLNPNNNKLLRSIKIDKAKAENTMCFFGAVGRTAD